MHLCESVSLSASEAEVLLGLSLFSQQNDHTMTTVLSQKGQVFLPDAVRQLMQLHAGDDLEVSMEDENTITLRRITQPLSKRPSLDDLLAQVTLENLHPATEGK